MIEIPNRRDTKASLDPIGPSTPLVDPAAFLNESTALLLRVEQAKAALRATLEQSGNAERVRERCSTTEMLDDNSKWHADRNVTTDLAHWHESRLYPPAPGQRKDDHVSDEADSNDDSERGTDDGERPNFASIDPETQGLLDKADQSRVRIFKRLPNRQYFLRRTYFTDYNSLSHLLPASPLPSPPATTPLSSLVYTLTIHPIPRVEAKVSFSTRAQVLVLLGSTTLWELRTNILAGGDEVPKEAPEEVESDEDGQEAEEGENRKRKKRRRWLEERRNVGSCFAIEGALYADGQEGVQDYAQMIVNLIDSVEWGIKKAPAVTAIQPGLGRAADGRYSNLRDSVFRPDLPPERHTASHSPDADLDQQTINDKPAYTIATKMQDTPIGSIPLRLRSPYWYLHQGNCEHVFTIDSIRHVHSSDPLPSTGSYPITTFLSRQTTPKCRICDRDPGVAETLDDELAGESPALMCRKCFELLHGVDGADGVEWVPKLV